MLYAIAWLIALGAATTYAREPVVAAVIAPGDSTARPTTVTDVAALLEEELRRTGRYTMVERSRVREVLEEAAFQQSGVTAPEGAVELGRLLNATQLLYVQGQPAGRGRQITVRAVDVATGQVVLTETVAAAPGPAGARAAARTLAGRLANAAAAPSAEDMVSIPGTAFTMGTDLGGRENGPAHQVTVASFLLDRYEVSQVSYDDWQSSRGRAGGVPASRPGLPALNVSWQEAAGYCEARGKRLPTEAEWELAATGGAGRTYPWGEAPPSPARARFNGVGPVAVDGLPAGASPEGIHQLAGNAAEWVQDWWDADAYRDTAAGTAEGPADGEYRVVRGGSWDRPADELRNTARSFQNPDRGAADVGFRCARTAPAQP